MTIQVTWGPPEPPYYDDRATPYVLEPYLNGSSDEISFFATTLDGETGTPDGVLGTGWLSWTAPQQESMTFTFELDEPMTVTLYVDGVQVGEETSASPSFSGVAVPASGTVEARVGTRSGGGAGTISWAATAVPLELAGQVIAYMRVEVYDRFGKLITEVPRRLDPSIQDLLNSTGTGSVALYLDDPMVRAMPQILKPRNIVKLWVGDECLGFRVRSRSQRWVSAGEYAERIVVLSGPLLENLLDDIMVRHDNGEPRPDSPSERKYDWSSRANSWSGNKDLGWYKPSQWNRQIVTAPLTNPPGGGWNADNTDLDPVDERDKAGFPKDWPEEVAGADWMFIYRRGERNAYFGGQNEDFTQNEWENRYFRRSFYIDRPMLVRIFATADEYFTLHLDSEQIIEQRNYEMGYTSYTYIDVRLSAGFHVLAANCHSVPSPKVGDGTDAFLCAVVRLRKKEELDEVLFTSSQNWSAFYGEDVPGWTRSQVLFNFVQEGKERGHATAKLLKIDFQPGVDSDGVPWPASQSFFNEAVPIGTRGTELAAMLTEGGGCDIWVEASDLSVKCAYKRGSDKSAAIKLEPGRNVLEWETGLEEDVYNVMLGHFDGGWVEHRRSASVREYGDTELLVDLGNVKQAKVAKRILVALAKGLGWARERAGVGDFRTRPVDQPAGTMVSVLGAQPLIDFGVGDYVTGMDSTGQYRRMRVVGLSLTESDGVISYDPELETDDA